MSLHLYPQLDPGPTATVGGMLSTGCSGSQCSVIVNVLSPLLTPPDSQCRPLWHSEGRMVLECCQNTSFFCPSKARRRYADLRQTVVLPSGEVIKTRRRSRKSSAGFDVTKLFIGAEGTLGIVTEVTIRLAPVLPTTVATARFPNMRKASEAVIEILNTGIGVREPSISLCLSWPRMPLMLPYISPSPRRMRRTRRRGFHARYHGSGQPRPSVRRR